VHRLDAARFHQSDPSGVVAAILKPFEAVQNDRLAGSTAGIAYNAAHASSPGSGAAAGRRNVVPADLFVLPVAEEFCKPADDRTRPGGTRRRTSMNLRLVTRRT
jgi:hypothetical protein